MQQAQSLTKGKTKFFISSWTAPLWMKIHEVWAGYAPLKKKYYQTWTDYTMKFLDAFAKHNITYWGLTTGNEPSYGFERIPHPIFGSMAFDPVEQASIVPYKTLLRGNLMNSLTHILSLILILVMKFFQTLSNILFKNNLIKSLINGQFY